MRQFLQLIKDILMPKPSFKLAENEFEISIHSVKTLLSLDALLSPLTTPWTINTKSPRLTDFYNIKDGVSLHSTPVYKPMTSIQGSHTIEGKVYMGDLVYYRDFKVWTIRCSIKMSIMKQFLQSYGII